MAAAISLYLDENLSPRIAEQLRRRGIRAESVQELGLRGDSDANHLARATSMGAVLVTADSDYLVLAAQGIEHSGIAFGAQADLSLGDWVKSLELICQVYTPDDMKNHIEYL